MEILKITYDDFSVCLYLNIEALKPRHDAMVSLLNFLSNH